MEYISAEEFLKQDKEIRNVFIDWWKPKFGDLVFYEDCSEYVLEVIDGVYEKENYISTASYTQEKNFFIVTLTETKLRKFIEDNGFRVLEISRGKYTDKWYIKISKNDEFDIRNFEGTESLLESLWRVALEIVKESLFKR